MKGKCRSYCFSSHSLLFGIFEALYRQLVTYNVIIATTLFHNGKNMKKNCVKSGHFTRFH